ncbi:MAG TPA: DinB family protein [Pyrinomonadaceae bacterium]|nr:DinB family protein [Pyrinomonadaceae bacterium]
MTKNGLLAQLAATKTETSQYFDLSESDLTKMHREKSWNIRQILHHLADTEMILHTRIKKIIAEPKQVVWNCDQDDWNDAFGYFEADLGVKKQAFEVTRQLNIELIEKFYDKFWQKEFVHSEMGLRLAKDEFEKIGWHNEKHLEQIRKALGK